MEDEDFVRALKELPRIPASADFSDRVLRSLHRRRSRARPAAAVVFAVVLAGLALGRARAVRRSRMLAAREATSLREEISRMKQALPTPVIALSEENGVREVVDLRRVPGRRANVL